MCSLSRLFALYTYTTTYVSIYMCIYIYIFMGVCLYRWLHSPLWYSSSFPSAQHSSAVERSAWILKAPSEICPPRGQPVSPSRRGCAVPRAPPGREDKCSKHHPRVHCLPDTREVLPISLTMSTTPSIVQDWRSPAAGWVGLSSSAGNF